MAQSPAARTLGSIAVLAVVLASAGIAAADDRALQPQHLGLHTGALLFPAPGVLVASVGAEYLPEVTNDLAGVEGELLRAPTVDLQLALADHAMFQVTWPAYNRLRVHRQIDPPPLGRRFGRDSFDWGDVTVATLIRFTPEHHGWPAAGLRFAAKLPNTNEKLGIGENTTDVFATVLLARSFGDRVGVFTDLGLGILTEPVTLFAQKDVFTYGVLVDGRLSPQVHAVSEVTGQKAAREPRPGTVNHSELRAGLEWCRRRVHVSALAIHRLTGEDLRGMGVSLNLSTSFTVLDRAAASR
jgi:hypothetical protein